MLICILCILSPGFADSNVLTNLVIYYRLLSRKTRKFYFSLTDWLVYIINLLLSISFPVDHAECPLSFALYSMLELISIGNRPSMSDKMHQIVRDNTSKQAAILLNLKYVSD